MRIIIFGAGAIGTYVGCSLINAGAEVIFFDRPESCTLIQQKGLHVSYKDETIHVNTPACCSTIKEIEKLAPFNLGIVAVKSFDTSELMKQLHTIVDLLPPLLSLQNGVENEPLLQSLVEENNAIFGSVTTAIHRKQTGEVVVERLRGIGLAGQHPMLPDFVQLFSKAGLHARQFPMGQAFSMKWSKMLTNLLTNAQAAILQMQPAKILAHPDLFAVEAKQILETTLVMKKLGLQILNLPGTQVKLMTWLFINAPVGIARPILVLAAGKGRGDKLPSLLIDTLAKRKQSEVSYLNGAVTRFGKQVGISTPVNQFLSETLLKITSGELDSQIYADRPDLFLADIHKAEKN